jgi:hypothetical protein
VSTPSVITTITFDPAPAEGPFHTSTASSNRSTYPSPIDTFAIAFEYTSRSVVGCDHDMKLAVEVDDHHLHIRRQLTNQLRSLLLHRLEL